ncbi:MAG TPA: glycosyl hydrolase family 8 [Polyangiaceae bacterium]
MISRALAVVLAGVGITVACSNRPEGTIADDDGNDTPRGGNAPIAGKGGGAGTPQAGTSGGGAGGSLGGASGGGSGGTSAGTAGTNAGTAGSSGSAGTGGSAGSAGTAGASGSSGAAGTAGTGPIYEPGPPYDFPQGYRSSHCTYPTGADPELARAAFQRWKTELVTADGAGENLRVRRPNNEGDTTVSEGIGYGMIFAVVFDEQDMFDKFWKYSQGRLNQNGLMNWKVDPSGNVPMDGGGAATDADEDMAWALLLADKKWGGSGSLGMPYIDVAKGQIQKIWDHEVDHGRGELLLAGDSWGTVVTHNPSYFAPNQYRWFAQVTGQMGWNTVIDKNYAVLMSTLKSEFGNQDNGLVPAWTDPDGRPMAPFNGAPTHYQYDSARIPFRIAQDYCDFGEPRAKEYLDKISNFFQGVGADMIVDGYDLNGMPRAENPLPAQSALFVGAAGVGAMSDASRLPFVDATYQLLVGKEMLPPSYYFNLSWQVFALLMMTGNLYDYSLVP